MLGGGLRSHRAEDYTPHCDLRRVKSSSDFAHPPGLRNFFFLRIKFTVCAAWRGGASSSAVAALTSTSTGQVGGLLMDPNEMVVGGAANGSFRDSDRPVAPENSEAMGGIFEQESQMHGAPLPAQARGWLAPSLLAASRCLRRREMFVNIYSGY